MAIILIIKSGDKTHRVELSATPITIGRSSSCHLKLVDSMISGKHLSVFLAKGSIASFIDLESTNGTFLNEIKRDEANIYIDDEIQIGEISIKLAESEMSPKELKIHTSNADKIQMTFVSLASDTKSAVREAMEKTRASQIITKPLVSNDKKSSRQDEIIKMLQEGSSNDDEGPGAKTRVLNKAKALKGHNKENVAISPGDGELFDLEASSGETKMLKIEKPKSNKKK